jgi:hypothetical protein
MALYQWLLVIFFIGNIFLWHNDGTDDIKKDGGTRKQGKEEKSDSEQGSINTEILGESTKNTKEPTVLRRLG